MKDVIAQLLRAILTRGPNSADAGLKLMLLVERECVYSPNDDLTRGIRTIYGESTAQFRLSADEINEIIDTLLAEVASSEQPLAEAVWTIVRSYKSKIVPPLANVLRASMADTAREAVANAALYAMMTTGVSSEHRELALEAIREAADKGQGDIQAMAAAYLEHYQSLHNEDLKKGKKGKRAS